ncbi:MAG TPA: outer membrane protein assembly factor BamE [Thermoanaerobaculia bacterium]|nr:outer membrane protein assembly factor BamE [Thermoanaerobaculia bacterium]
MSKIRMTRWAGALPISLLLLAAVACAPAGDRVDEEARTQAWTGIEQAREGLDQKRQDLADLRARIAQGVEGIELPEGAEQTAEEALAELVAQAAALETEVTAAADDLMAKIVNFINEDPMIQGEEPTELQLAGIRAKSSEDLVLALEYVEKGGDYKRAEDIIARALELDPDNAELAEKLAWVRQMRFMTEERFAAVETGMTQEQVRQALGQPNLNNVRDFEGGVVAWFYPRGANAAADGAAGVYFRPERGVLKVYEANFDAVKPTAEGG